MKSAGKARNNGLYRHIRTSKEIIRNLLNDLYNIKSQYNIQQSFAMLSHNKKCVWIAARTIHTHCFLT